MKFYKSYLTAFNAFVSAGNEYVYAKKVIEFGGDPKDAEKKKKALKNTARTLLSEYNKVPASLQIPELKEKIDKALSL